MMNGLKYTCSGHLIKSCSIHMYMYFYFYMYLYKMVVKWWFVCTLSVGSHFGPDQSLHRKYYHTAPSDNCMYVQYMCMS